MDTMWGFHYLRNKYDNSSFLLLSKLHFIIIQIEQVILNLPLVVPLRISAGDSAKLIEDFRAFTQLQHENSAILLQLGHDRFHPNPFQFIIFSIISSMVYKFDTIKASLNNP